MAADRNARIVTDDEGRAKAGSQQDGADGAAPLIDHDRFEQIMGFCLADGGAELLARLHDDLSRIRRMLPDAFADADPDSDALSRLSHELIGLAGSFGAERLHQRARRLNAALHYGEAANMNDYEQPILVLVDQLLAFVARRRAAIGAAR
ncbi:MAG: Hpt domain-containing protein [Paracoccaceae bacterium]